MVADWPQRCQQLIDWGADGDFAWLLLSLPNGPEVTLALSEDRPALIAILGSRTAKARAEKLKRYANTVEVEVPKRAMPTIKIGPNRLTAKPLSPAPTRGMIPTPPPGQANNPAAVKKAARGGRK